MNERYKLIANINSAFEYSVDTAFDTHNNDVVMVSKFNQPFIFNDEFIELYRTYSSTLIDIENSNEELILFNIFFDNQSIENYSFLDNNYTADLLAYNYLNVINKYNDMPTFLQYMFTLPKQIYIIGDTIQSSEFLIYDEYYDNSTFKDVMSNIGSVLKLILDKGNSVTTKITPLSYFVDSLIVQEAPFNTISEILYNYSVLTNNNDQIVIRKELLSSTESELEIQPKKSISVDSKHRSFNHINEILSRNEKELSSLDISNIDKVMQNKYGKLLILTFASLSFITVILLYVVFIYL